MCKSYRCLAFPLLFFLLSCAQGGREEEETLLLFAAASLTESMGGVVDRFEERAPYRVTVNLAGSHTLATQILEGAPADLFASADRVQIDRVIDGGLCEEAVPFATNRLVLLVPAGNPAGIERWNDLRTSGIRVVLAGPHVPAGAYARVLLDRLGIRGAVEENVVSIEQTVKGVVGKVVLGEADAGVVFATDRTPSVARKTISIEAPDSAAVRAMYFVGVVKAAPNRPGADAFVRFLLSQDGRDILSRFGFGSP